MRGYDAWKTRSPDDEWISDDDRPPVGDDDQRLEIAELRAALAEMVAAHSMANIGLGASKRRLEAIKKARAVLGRTMTAQTEPTSAA